MRMRLPLRPSSRSISRRAAMNFALSSAVTFDDCTPWLNWRAMFAQPVHMLRGM